MRAQRHGDMPRWGSPRSGARLDTPTSSACPQPRPSASRSAKRVATCAVACALPPSSPYRVTPPSVFMGPVAACGEARRIRSVRPPVSRSAAAMPVSPPSPPARPACQDACAAAAAAHPRHRARLPTRTRRAPLHGRHDAAIGARYPRRPRAPRGPPTEPGPFQRLRPGPGPSSAFAATCAAHAACARFPVAGSPRAAPASPACPCREPAGARS